MTTNKQTLIAVLDDYANIAPKHFSTVQGPVKIDYYNQTFNPSIPSDLETLVTQLQPYTVISTMRERTPFKRPLLTRLPNLKFLLTTGPRNAGIDLECCRERGIIVAGNTLKPGVVPGHSDTNEQTWALLLCLAKNLAEDDRRVKCEPRGWQSGLVFGLAGRTLGILGLGKLGVQCAVTGILGFGMDVIAWSENLTQEKADEAGKGRGLESGRIRVVASKEELLRSADVLSIHYVLSERSRGMLGAEELAMMKPTALLVNTSRGPIVDEEALLNVLRQGKIRGAALDVFDTEPLPSESPWRSEEWGRNGCSHVVLSPHAGYIEEETMNWMYKQNAENLQNWLDGKEVKWQLH